MKIRKLADPDPRYRVGRSKALQISKDLISWVFGATKHMQVHAIPIWCQDFLHQTTFVLKLRSQQGKKDFPVFRRNLQAHFFDVTVFKERIDQRPGGLL